jgi:H+/Cl- antiporter ClcA
MNQMNPKDIGKALIVACAVGLPAALAALALLEGSHELTNVLWTDLPEAAGFSGSSWWYVLLIPTIGGLLAGLAVRHLPGSGGHEPIKGFSPSPVQPNAILGVVLAALASLGFGAVLGPEAPLVALGSALGLWFAHLFKLTDKLAPLAGAAGLFAAVGALFGNPLLAAFLILEVLGMTAATSGAPLAAVVVPGMLASAVGYLVFVGVDSWTGITADGFTPITLPDYPTVKLLDLLWAIVIGLVMAVLVAVVRQIGERVHAVTTAQPALLAPVAGLAVGALAVLFHAMTGQAPHLVLFSGEADTGTVVSQSPTWGLGVLLVLLMLKSLAYATSLGSLFRGGPVFPSLFLGVVAGMMFTHVGGENLTATPAVVAAMAAACAAMLRLPLSAVMLAVFLTSSAGLESTSIALFASVAGFLGSVVIEKKQAAQQKTAATAATAAPPS